MWSSSKSERGIVAMMETVLVPLIRCLWKVAEQLVHAGIYICSVAIGTCPSILAEANWDNLGSPWSRITLI